VTQDNAEQTRMITCEVHWQEHYHQPRELAFVEEIAGAPGVTRLKWTPVSGPGGHS
jgi:hypothetical protein